MGAISFEGRMIQTHRNIATRRKQPPGTRRIKQDLTGMKFGKLFVLSYSHWENHASRWVCACSCGTVRTVRGFNLTSGRTVTCGCGVWASFLSSSRNRTHGMARSQLYKRWQGMKGRCHHEKHADYHNYGARGITVCDEWKNSFETFRDWAL